MEALEIVFPQYWLQAHCDDLFPCHLSILKQWYCGLKEVHDGIGDNAYSRQIAHPFYSYELDLQTSLFKMMMKAHTAKLMEALLDKNPGSKF
jgi:hypothetical protein